MGIKVNLSRCEDRHVLSAEGSADEQLLRQLADGIAAMVGETGAVVVDLDHLTMGDTPAVADFLARLAEPIAAGRVVFCAADAKRHQLLHRWSRSDLVVVGSRPDAARLLAGSRPDTVR